MTSLVDRIFITHTHSIFPLCFLYAFKAFHPTWWSGWRSRWGSGHCRLRSWGRSRPCCVRARICVGTSHSVSSTPDTTTQTHMEPLWRDGNWLCVISSMVWLQFCSVFLLHIKVSEYLALIRFVFFLSFFNSLALLPQTVFCRSNLNFAVLSSSCQ